jgi:hypothetical protein
LQCNAAKNATATTLSSPSSSFVLLRYTATQLRRRRQLPSPSSSSCGAAL